MLSKNQIKLITNLQKKKFRYKNQLFVAEGVKVIKEFLKSKFELYALYSTTDIFIQQTSNCSFITEEELKKISNLTTPQVALAVFKIPQAFTLNSSGISLVLDGIRDPGNLGTIIRQCDWFGIKQLVCSLDTVDAFNPKVVQASMGSLTRVEVIYTQLEEFLREEKRLILGAFMDGCSIYNKDYNAKDVILVLGNEANGIRPSVESLINLKVSIPQYGKIQDTESLNVAMAGAILTSEIKRKSFL